MDDVAFGRFAGWLRSSAPWLSNPGYSSARLEGRVEPRGGGLRWGRRGGVRGLEGVADRPGFAASTHQDRSQTPSSESTGRPRLISKAPRRALHIRLEPTSKGGDDDVGDVKSLGGQPRESGRGVRVPGRGASLMDSVVLSTSGDSPIARAAIRGATDSRSETAGRFIRGWRPWLIFRGPG